MNYKILIGLSFIFPLLVACGDQGSSGRTLIHPDDTVLLEVDGAPVTVAMLEFMMDNRGIGEDDRAAMQALLDELVRLQVVANAAKASGLADQPRLRASRAIRDLEALQMAYFDALYRRDPITDEAIEQAYQSQIKRSGDYQYRLETVAFASQQAAMATIVELSSGDGAPINDEVWAQAVESGQSSPDTDWVDRSQLPDRVRAELAQAPVNHVLSLPLPAPDGERWLVARISDRRAFEAPPLDQLREGIARSLVRQRINAEVDALYDEADIVPMRPASAPAGATAAEPSP